MYDNISLKINREGDDFVFSMLKTFHLLMGKKKGLPQTYVILPGAYFHGV